LPDVAEPLLSPGVFVVEGGDVVPLDELLADEVVPEPEVFGFASEPQPASNATAATASAEAKNRLRSADLTGATADTQHCVSEDCTLGAEDSAVAVDDDPLASEFDTGASGVDARSLNTTGQASALLDELGDLRVDGVDAVTELSDFLSRRLCRGAGLGGVSVRGAGGSLLVCGGRGCGAHDG
jgi:hypothetical protein